MTKFQANQSVLLTAATTAARAAGSKVNTLLDGIKIDVISDSVIAFTGYNNELGIKTQIDGFNGETGSVVVPHRMFCDILKKLDDGQIDIAVDDKFTVKIKQGTTKFQIKGQPADDYPALPKIENKLCNVDANKLKDMVISTMFAASSDNTRPILTGVRLSAKDGLLESVAIDGFRVALRSVKTEVPDMGYTIPVAAASEILKLKTKKDENISISASDNQLMFSAGETEVTTRLIQGEFMNYQSIIPTTGTTMLTVDVEALRSTVDRAMLVAGEDKKSVMMKITETEVEVSSKSSTGELKEKVQAEVQGDKLEISFNPKYLLEALSAVSDDEVIFNFNGDMGPFVVKPLEGDGKSEDSFCHLILPLRK